MVEGGDGRERTIFSLRGLYEQYGYRKYKMNKFESYDLYQENRDFLPSERIITFPDAHGKLLALKPDITLSIVRTTPGEAGAPRRVYYCENVYRAPAAEEDMKELLQLGIEYLGEVDLYAESEVLLLALRSLAEISRDSVLCVSHMGFLQALYRRAGAPPAARAELSRAIAARNKTALMEACTRFGIPARETEALSEVCSLYGEAGEVLPKLSAIAGEGEGGEAVRELAALCRILSAAAPGSALMLDFSVTGNTDYYNGLVFQGFVEGIPTAVLSGGRYDSLLGRLGKCGGAIGFAVYTDLLERLYTEDAEAEVFDVLLVYGDSDPAAVAKKVLELTAAGLRVTAQKNEETTVRYRRLCRLPGEA